MGCTNQFLRREMAALGIEETRPMGFEVAAQAMPGVTDGGVDLVPIVREDCNPFVRRSPRWR